MTVLTFGAGVQWSEAYEAVRQHSRVIVGAAGGWFAGGGNQGPSTIG